MFANARITIRNAVFNVLVHLPFDRVPPLDLVDLCRNLEFIQIGWAAYEESSLGLPEIKSEIRFEKANAEIVSPVAAVEDKRIDFRVLALKYLGKGTT